MLTVEESVVISKPRPEVWDFLMDPENVTVYSSNIMDYEVLSGGAHEVGRVARAVVKVAGIKLESTDELVDIQEGRSGKLVSQDAKVPYTLEIVCEDADAGTKVTWHQESESFKGVFKFADPIVLKLYARDVRSNLEKAKTILEA